jgi:hypothetical protein
MKMVPYKILVWLISLCLTGLSAKADLIQATDPSFGLNSLTIDTTTGLGWLDVSLSAGLSYQQVLADTQPGGSFSGFRFATAQEVLNLYTSAGIPETGFYPLSTSSITSLLSLIGITGTINGQPGVVALSATSLSPGANCAPAIYATGASGVEEYWVNDGGYKSGGTIYGATTSYPDLGSWLVTDVPEPSAHVLAIAGLIGFTCMRRRQKTA